MKSCVIIFLVMLTLTISACGSYTFDCEDLALQPVFIGYSVAEIDTLYFKKYQANTGYGTLIQTDTAIQNRSLNLYSRHDSIDANTYYKIGITAGFDWELVIPAVNKTIQISNIVSEKRQGKCNSGIFSMDKFGCTCENPIYSAMVANSTINFSSSNISLYLKK